MDSLWAQILIQVILILLNAFFASSEIAVLSLNENRVRKRAGEGSKKAARMVMMMEQPSAFLSTIQIGITLAGFLGSAFAANNFSGRISAGLSGLTGLPRGSVHTLSLVVTTLLLSYFTLVLGELVPKRVGMKKAEAVAGFSSRVILGITKVMKPAIWLLSTTTNLVLRLFGIDPKDEEEQITEEDLLMMINRCEEAGHIETEEKEYIQNIFRFNNITAEDVMTHRTRMVALPVDSTDRQVLASIESSGFSRIPVYDGVIDNIIGILITRSFLLDRYNGNHTPLKELLTPAYFVPKSVRADLLFRDLQRKKTHVAIVQDRYGGTSGMATMEDLLEEIVGDIHGEFDGGVH